MSLWGTQECRPCGHHEYDHHRPNGTTVSNGCDRCGCNSFKEATEREKAIRWAVVAQFAVMDGARPELYDEAVAAIGRAGILKEQPGG